MERAVALTTINKSAERSPPAFEDATATPLSFSFATRSCSGAMRERERERATRRRRRSRTFALMRVALYPTASAFTTSTHQARARPLSPPSHPSSPHPLPPPSPHSPPTDHLTPLTQTYTHTPRSSLTLSSPYSFTPRPFIFYPTSIFNPLAPKEAPAGTVDQQIGVNGREGEGREGFSLSLSDYIFHFLLNSRLKWEIASFSRYRHAGDIIKWTVTFTEIFVTIIFITGGVISFSYGCWCYLDYLMGLVSVCVCVRVCVKERERMSM